jgi:NAD(P)-dependent dehydrogenase (short-subunit alcohol dehydrogenase family)
MRFEGKVALVTGGGAGIGRAIGRRLAREGAAVALLDVDAATAAGVAAEITAAGGRAVALRGDVTVEADIAGALGAVADRFGGLDALICNAAATTRPRLEDVTPADWDRETGVTLRAVFLCCRAALPALAARRGNVVAIGSVNGSVYVGNPAYSAAKAGLRSLMQAIAVEWGPRGVRANLISPGTVRTEHESWRARLARDPAIFERVAAWYPVGRVGEPDDVAAAVAFLASGEAGFISGAELVVDGGLTAGLGGLAAALG